ncbi:multidrug resistance-associated protein, putative [Entamoeba invadens IP1]|uniref:Multidrug resistance-associated protein, putative n=1 Tax=Entamoeba invadens IP1 TaxID=370355 RepID=A0A0A1U605_ENTIV|nr:multidrug resistance-associated protein, putative [Entamoeba invadens IP1]ELP88310.1 multidrug resistance-associated protein, putative [Entamoeba invadens IP1]|eukprot:XP_004255081.1 multidrug resistance-associated protein, putative [Entamoeba invadens IP1]
MTDKQVFKNDEIEMENETTSTTEEDYFYEEEETVKYDKSPNSILKFFNVLFFRQPLSQMIIGRRRNLRLKDMKPLPKTLEVEKYNNDLQLLWSEEECCKNPSLMWVIFKKEWKSMLFGYFTIAVYELFSLAFPLLTQFIIKWLNNKEANVTFGIVWILLSVIFQLITTLAGEFGKKWLYVVSLRVRNGLISLIYEKALKLNAAGIAEPGKLVNLMSTDAAIFVGNFEISVYGLASPVMFIVLFVMIGIYIGKWVFVPLIVFVVFLVFNILFGVLYGLFYTQFIRMKDKRLSFINEVLKNIKFVKYNSWEKAMEKKTKYLRFVELVKLFFVGISRGSFFTFTIEVGSAMAIVLFVVMVFTKQQFQLANVITSISLFNAVRAPIRTLGLLASCSSTIFVSIKRIMNFLLTLELKPVESSSDFSDDAIEMKNAKHIYPNGETAFECETLNIKKGELVCVLGNVGSGKSSFLLSLLNELEKFEGETGLHGKVSYASQTPWLMNVSVRENIVFMESFDKKRYNEVINSVCLAKDIESLPGGDSYVVAEKGANLSGGQRQRISLARALYGAKDIVLLDDPLSAVDFKVGNFIFENAIQKALKGKTRLVVTNQTYFIQNADRILVVENNKLVFNGSLEELKLSKVEASGLVKILSEKSDDHKETEEDTNFVSGDAVHTKIQEESREVGGLSPLVYYNYIMSGSIFAFLAILVFLSGRIAALFYFNTFLTKWGKSLHPLLKLPQGDRAAFNNFCYSFVADFLALFLCEMSIVFLCLGSSKKLHEKMMHHIMKTKLGYFDITPIGRIQNLFTKDFHNLDFNLSYYIEPIIMNLSSILITFITISQTNIYLVILVLILVILFIGLYFFTSKAVIALVRLDSITRGPIFVHYDQTLLGLPTVRSAGAQDTFKEKLVDKIKSNTIAIYTSKMARFWFLQRMDWLGAIVSVATVIVIVVNKIKGFMEPSLAGTALTNITNISNSISNFSLSIIEIETLMQSTERILKMNDLKKEESERLKEKYNTISASWPNSGKIEFVDFKFRYRKGLQVVLKNVSTTIQDKEKIGVVGRTGSGKSTLMAGLFRIEEPLSGKIMVDGVDITTIPLRQLRKRMCILPQESTLFSGTVRDNLDPEGKYDDKQIKEALSLVESPCDLDDIVTEGGDNYSQGQKQLICIARALLKKTKILIMDEATANIDIQTDKTIQEMVKRNFEDLTVITVAHRLQTVMNSNRVMVFESGELIEDDSPIELIKRENTRFNKLVQQSGCSEDLVNMAKNGSNQNNYDEQMKTKSLDTSGDFITKNNKNVKSIQLLNPDSTLASPIAFQETFEREISDQKLINSQNDTEATNSSSS